MGKKKASPKKIGFFSKLFKNKEEEPKKAKRKTAKPKIKAMPIAKKLLPKKIQAKPEKKQVEKKAKPLIKAKSEKREHAPKLPFKKKVKKALVLKRVKPQKRKIKPGRKLPPLKKGKNKIVKKNKPLKIKHNKKKPFKAKIKEFMKTGIEGLDTLLEKGVPKGASVLLAGGAGSGKTIMGLQVINNLCKEGKKCLYMSFEESEERLREHMSDFGWDAKEFEKKGLLLIKRFNPFDITRSVDALLEKAKGELLIDVKPVILPDHFKPEFIVLDSLTAIASAFSAREESYRIYIEQLFRFLENIGATSFLITETEQMPTKFSTTGVEEFLADGVIVLYAIKMNDIRENAIEVLKMRGVNHQKKIVAMRVIENRGVEIYPEQEVYASMIEKKE